MRRLVRSLLYPALHRPGALAILAPALRHRVSVLFLHRFEQPGLQETGLAAGELRAQLAYLRRHRFNLADMGSLLAALTEGRPMPPRTVIYTVDDGYADFAHVAMPIFAEFDCPVTLFVTTGFVDGKVWLWWDRLDCAFQRSLRSEVSLDVAGLQVGCDLRTREDRDASYRKVSALVEFLPDAVRDETLRRVEEVLEVELPATPPGQWAACTWDDLRRCCGQGATVGPHSLTHPILSQVDRERARLEIGGSWERLRQMIPGALPCFCYPNGSAASFGARDIELVRQAGLIAACTTQPQAVCPQVSPWAIPRLWLDSDRLRFLQVVSGVEYLKQRVRGQ